MYYLYIIYSPGSDLFYIGITNDPLRRLNEHNSKPFNNFTSKHRPWEMKAYFAISESRKIALLYEKKLKSLKNRYIIEKLIQNKDKINILAQLVRVPTCRD